MNKIKALVTGGAGFIGSHLVDRLLKDGIHVAVVDNLSSGRRENINPDATFYCIDIKEAHLSDIFREESPDVVFHLAAQASVPNSINDPLEDAKTNIIGSINILEQCRDFHVERLIYSSTGGAIYGDPSNLPCPETTAPNPLSAYGVSKYASECYVNYFALTTGLKYSILRYGNVYGPRQDPYGEAGVIAIFAERMINDLSVEIYGDGNQERDFVYVGDVVDANITALRQEVNQIYNIGVGKGTSVNAVFNGLAKLTGYKKNPIYQPHRAGDVYRIFLDVLKAKTSLGWVHKINLETGLALTVNSFIGNPSDS